MGDRCAVWMTYRSEDESKFVQILGSEFYSIVEEERDTWREVMIEEANWGLCHERHELAEAGLSFLGHHAAGGDYPEAVFAAFGGRQADVPALEGRPVVTLTACGDPEIEMIGMARKYLRLAEEAREKLGLTDPD